MNNISYKIFLTRSYEAAQYISSALSAEREGAGYFSTGSGDVRTDARIPAIYHDAGWFYALAEYESKDAARPEYTLTVC